MRFRPACIRFIKNGCAFIWIFAGNIVFQKLNEKAWTIFCKNYTRKSKQMCNIRTIQELLVHSDVRTTMIYTHTVKSVTIKEARSPLDF